MVRHLEIRSQVNAKALCSEALQSKWKITDWQIAGDNPLGTEAVVWLISKNETCDWCEPGNRAEQLVRAALFQQARSLDQVNWKLWAKHGAGKTEKGLTGLLRGWLADTEPAASEQGCISGIRSLDSLKPLCGCVGGRRGLGGSGKGGQMAAGWAGATEALGNQWLQWLCCQQDVMPRLGRRMHGRAARWTRLGKPEGGDGNLDPPAKKQGICQVQSGYRTLQRELQFTQFS